MGGAQEMQVHPGWCDYPKAACLSGKVPTLEQENETHLPPGREFRFKVEAQQMRLSMGQLETTRDRAEQLLGIEAAPAPAVGTLGQHGRFSQWPQYYAGGP